MKNCARVTVRDLAVHGAYLTMNSVNEQMHGVFIAEGCEEIAVEQVRVYQSAGDGIRFLGSPTERVRQVWIDRCRLIQNKRSGIAFQRAVEQVWVRGCYIEMTPPSTDSCLDFEPTGPISDIAPRDVIIDANVMVHGTPTIAVALSGRSGADRMGRVQVTNNQLVGGSIFCTDVDRLMIRGNIVVVPVDGPPRIPLHVRRGGRELVIVANLLVNDNPEVDAVLRLGRTSQRGVIRAVVSDNLCVTASGTGIALVSATDVAVTGNMVMATGACVDGVLVHAENADMDGITVRNNHISVEGQGGWATGVRIMPTSGAWTTSRSSGTRSGVRPAASHSRTTASGGRRSAR